MRVVVAQHLGLCFGVKRAIAMAEQSTREGETYCLGELIHNPVEMARLYSLGLKSVCSVREARGGTLILRTHGSQPEEIDQARALGLRVLDSTCPHVRAVQLAAQDLSRKGYRVVIVGDPEHPEVSSVLKWAGEGAVTVRDAEEAGRLSGDRFGVISQTTEQVERVNEVVRVLKQKGEVEARITICDATKERQESVSQLARRVKTVIVVGGTNSANCNQLARIASLELASDDVRVNMVSPDAVFSHGTFRSGLWAEVGPGRMKARGLDEAGLEAYYRSRNLLKARVTATHVANAVLFFATRQTPTTGATIPVDGGLPDATPR